MPITVASIGEIYRIVRIGGSDEVRQHLQDMGVIVDEEIKLLTNLGGNCLVAVKDTRIAINHDMARRIIVASV